MWLFAQQSKHACPEDIASHCASVCVPPLEPLLLVLPPLPELLLVEPPPLEELLVEPPPLLELLVEPPPLLPLDELLLEELLLDPLPLPEWEPLLPPPSVPKPGVVAVLEQPTP